MIRSQQILTAVGLVTGAASVFAILCLTYDPQLYHTPANYIRDHRAVRVLPAASGSGRDGRRAKILLVTYHRGGSSFLGEIFGQNPRVFYWYEPLRNLYRHFPHQIRTRTDVVERFYEFHSNGSLTYLSPKLIDLLISTLLDVLACDVSHVNRNVLSEEFISRWVHMPRVRAYAECIILNGDHVLGHRICADVIRLSCLQSEAISVKTVRLPVYAVRELLRRDDEVKVVYYVRDPRAVLMSRADRFGWSASEVVKKATPFCRQLIEDFEHYRRTKAEYPDNVRLIRYEDLALDPVQTATRIYDYVDLGLPDGLRDWIIEHTTANSSDGRTGTTRMSSSTANRWRHVMEPNVARQITDSCREVLNIHGYEI